MLKKGSKLYSILTGTCPKCQNENMYVNKNPYVITETMKMHEHCSHCGLRYKMEPNFFFGAMYVSYGLAVLVGMIIFGVSFFLFEQSVKVSFISILISLILLMPWITRISRNIYINLFVHYDKTSVKRT
jgi:uncharacterized protein (DUF983 family)